MIAKVEIGAASLSDIAEKACKVYKQELTEAEDMRDVKCVLECLEDVARLWEALDDNFDYEDELLLTIERREVQEDGTDCTD